jgi:hypothetical protein
MIMRPLKNHAPPKKAKAGSHGPRMKGIRIVYRRKGAENAVVNEEDKT